MAVGYSVDVIVAATMIFIVDSVVVVIVTVVVVFEVLDFVVVFFIVICTIIDLINIEMKIMASKMRGQRIEWNLK